MLSHLYIKNYALIDELNIDFTSGFSVITGETGAGKSIILGAIGLLLGQRADSKAVKKNSQKCTIEANFSLVKYDMEEWFEENDLEYDDECIIRRELTAAGKSRGFINDTPVTLQQMRDLGEMLIDVHSQHQNLLLQKEDFQLNVLDIISSSEKVKGTYSAAYNAYKNAVKELEDLKNSLKEMHDNEDFMRFQLNELDNAALADGEQELLEQEQEASRHTEDVKTGLYEANAIINDDNAGVLTMMRQATQKVAAIADLYPGIAQLSERLEASFIEMKDIASDVESKAESVEYNPKRIEYINDRLDTIYTLEHKYHVDSVKSLLEERDKLQAAIENIDHSDEAIQEKEREVAELLAELQIKADKLSEVRKKVVNKIQKEIIARLGALGMPNVEFVVDIQLKEPSKDGQDKVAFLFSANKGLELRPVAQVASGGEIARVMLSLKAMISGAVKLPTIIFDEIDTGVSGRVAEQMAAIMHEMGENERQVLSITHLPQIAASGRNHYKVEKYDTAEGTTSVMRLLSDEERIDEIAQMLSGSDITEAARINAKELLQPNIKK